MSYANKTTAELEFIKQDAFEAAQFAKAMGNVEAELCYLDEVNNASTELYKRLKGV